MMMINNDNDEDEDDQDETLSWDELPEWSIWLASTVSLASLCNAEVSVQKDCSS